MTSESKSRVLYENLDTTFVNLWALLRNLSQRGFIGRVHVELRDYSADVFMTGSDTPLVHEIDRAAGTDTLEEAALHRLVLRAREGPGSISVFEGADEAVAVQSTTAPMVASDATPLSEPDKPSVASVIETPLPLIEATTESQPTQVVNNEPEAVADFSASPENPALVAPEPKDEIEWSAVVKASGELVGGVERALTGAGADFTSLFQSVRLDLADDYTFLDPMSDGFDYSNSVATLNAELPTDSYVAGLSETLRRVVDRVATGDRARRVRERVALELFSVARKRNDILARSGFREQLDRIAGTKVI
jgi:hypothetical protein